MALFTSGTTGTLKAVQHTMPATYRAVTHNVLSNLIDPRPGEIMLHAASMIHASGTFVMPYWIRGGTSAILPGFSPASYVEAIERWRPHALNLVPTMLQMLFQLPGIAQADFRSVETILYGASPMPRPVLERGLGSVGPGLRPILRPDRSAARHLPPHQGGSCRGVPGAAAVLRPPQRSSARSGWSTRRARKSPQASPARSCCARRS